MSRITKWKLEKNKVKVVFRLQFNATHTPQTGWDKLFISFSPADSGKTIAKTTKANVRNGTCKWADPIYETTRLLQDVKTKQFDEKLYKLVVSMGSSRSSILGEATIDLADYAEASKPSAVALPLQGCNAGTILHVTVQLLTSKTGFREFEQQREHRERGLQSGENKNDDPVTGKVLFSGETGHDHIDKVSSRVRFRPEAKELSSVEEEVELNEYADLTAGFDGSSNTSESLYAEKHDSSSAHETDSQGMQSEKGNKSDSQAMAQSSSSVHGWASDCSMDNELAIAYEENNRLRASLELAESSILELKLEVSTLQSQANELGSETEKFSQLLTAEISSSEELAKEVSVLKSECSNFKDCIERLRTLKSSCQNHGGESCGADSGHLVQDLQLRWMKGISVVEDRIKELQNKVCLGFYERDYRFLHSELEALLQIVQEVKLGARDEMSLLNKVTSVDVKETRATDLPNIELPLPGLGLELDLCTPENLLHHIGIPPLVSQGTDSTVAIDAMKAKIFDLVREVDEAKVERENLLRKMDQMECYYEALVQELEENQKQMLAELQNLRNEHSTCLYTISSSKAEMELMQQDMSQRVLQLADERRDLDALNKELERRAATSEAALKRARLNYSIAVDKLQKDLELLSSQVVSMFETNENLIKQAIPEPSQSQFLGYADVVQNLEEYDNTEQLRSKDQHVIARKLTLNGDVLTDDLKRSLCLQEELYRKVEEELGEMHSVNLHLDIFSRVLLETVFEANANAGMMKRDMYELAQHLEASNFNKEQMAIRLQAALEDVHILHEEKASCILRCSDLVLQNQSLEAELVSLSKANCLLTEKIMELEAIMVQHTEAQNRYEACVEENIALSTSLKQELLNNSRLQDEISLLKDDLLTVRANSEGLASSNENLHEDISFVQGKLAGMLVSYEKELSLLCNSSSHELELRDIRGLTMQLEEVQYSVSSKILHLMQEKQNLESEKSVAEVSLNAIRSEIICMKQKYKKDIQSMVAKFDVSTALVEKLQVELESVTNKLHLNSEVEEKYAQQNRELLDDLAAFEVELQNLVSKNGDISREIFGLDSIATELEQNDLTISELVQEKEDLMTSLHDKSEEFAKLTSEVSHLRDKLQDELQLERSLKDKLEGSVQNLTLQLNEKDDRLLDLEKQIAELVHFRQLASELEIEKSRLSHLLQKHDEHAAKLQQELSCVSGLEGSVRDLTSQLNETHDRLLDLEKQNAEMVHFRQLASDLEVEKSRHDQLLQQRGEHIIKLQEEMSCISGLEDSVLGLTSQLNEKNDRLLDLEKQNAELSELVHFRQLASELGVEKSRVDQLLQQRDEHVAKLQEELSCVSGLECSVRDLTSQLNEKHDRLLDLEKQHAELVSFRQLAADFEVEKCRLDQLVLQRDEHVAKLQNDLSCVSGLESSVRDLTSQLNEKNEKLLDLEKQNADLVHFRQLASELGTEKSRLDHLLQQRSKQMEKLQLEVSYFSDLKRHMLEIQEYAIASDVKFTVAMSHCETLNLEFVRQLKSSDGSTAELQKRCHDLQANLNQCLASEACSIKENKELLRSLSSVRSDLEASIAQNNVLSDAKYVNTVKLEEYKKEMTILEDSLLETNNHHALEVGKLKNQLANAEEELNYLSLCKEELEIMVIVLRGKLDELHPYRILQENNKDEMVTLQLQCNKLTHKCNELTHKLSEQALKTEEFRNLSIHLKELKDKADAECLQVREKRESEGPPVAMQESLRIVFIKEQYESKFQELKQQVSISKKHGEDMLLKLQDALDEIESRKRSEALHLRKNEDLALKILSLESELQSLLSDKREIMKDHDRIKAELECALLSLECCKEEKEKLEITLQERAREYSRIAAELTSTREELMNVTSSVVSKRENGQMSKVELAPNETNVNPSPDATPREDSSDAWNVKETTLFMDDRSEESSSPVKLLLSPDAASVGVHATTGDAPLEGYSPPSNGRHIDFSSEQFGSRNLRSSMEHLHEELERMKRENSLIPEDHYSDQGFEIFQSELAQLHKANEELRSMFPTFKDIAITGNALERVLALEIELAEALKAKNKPSLFQSSFLKQHSDDEAIFKSFRDINELIKEMLEIKEKQVAKENELREMHDRYSQLSLQFAEVEGERQKLKMTLKNVRASRTKLMQLNRSSSSIVDSPS
ncbi:putative leucine-rich repeat-containing protein DDB_G0290503 [Solanum tuberosum]|uniref:putative leucine-rich repeat-containing protein DDB_G0290503 n=1 Tax=Solanum tuberosum TaxID=4113 RepID=UPI0003D286C2|nr:PREDICTED: putative leucine-rich repeat-containing protein DDB_G0290503 [Solanum tuberosum]XP_006354032.1 PREDICTED: putative leucine-rich repeat-containing protein DDB_G0290503 [Solanum tuberosum]